jgi:hypothetical protein
MPTAPTSKKIIVNPMNKRGNMVSFISLSLNEAPFCCTYDWRKALQPYYASLTSFGNPRTKTPWTSASCPPVYRFSAADNDMFNYSNNINNIENYIRWSTVKANGHGSG